MTDQTVEHKYPFAFLRALHTTLVWEKGYSDHPKDPGGATLDGITQGTYDEYRKIHSLPPQPVRLMTTLERDAAYYELFWLRIGADNLPPPLALVAFDSAVNSGVNRGKSWVAESDGDWRKLLSIRLDFLATRETWPTFGKGWTRRISDILAAAASLDELHSFIVVSLDDENKVVSTVRSEFDSVLIRVMGDGKVYVRPDGG